MCATSEGAVPSIRPLRLGVLASGRGSNLQAILDAADAGRIPVEVAVVISDHEDAWALERARRRGIEAVFHDPLAYPGRAAYDAALAETLAAFGVELVCLAGWMRIVGRPLLAAFPRRIINIHPALLPSFPGLHVQRKALDHGVRFSGCTVHFVDEGVDTGPIIIQAVVPVFQTDTEESLSSRILAWEHRIYPEAIRLFAEGRLAVEGRRVTVSGPAPGPNEGDGLVNPPLG